MVRQAAPRSRSVIEQSVTIYTDLGPLPINRIPDTIWVKRKKDGFHLRVNEKDVGYDEAKKRDRNYPTRHFELAPDYDPEFDRAPAALEPEDDLEVKTSGYSEEDLHQLTVKEIKGLPEWPHVDPNRRYRDKTGMVAAVLEIRAGTAEPVQKKRKGKVSREQLKPSSQDQLVGS